MVSWEPHRVRWYPGNHTGWGGILGTTQGEVVSWEPHRVRWYQIIHAAKWLVQHGISQIYMGTGFIIQGLYPEIYQTWSFLESLELPSKLCGYTVKLSTRVEFFAVTHSDLKSINSCTNGRATNEVTVGHNKKKSCWGPGELAMMSDNRCNNIYCVYSNHQLQRLLDIQRISQLFSLSIINVFSTLWQTILSKFF